METHQLLFELSHPVRYDIMRLLADRPLRLTKIGENVDANNPEVSRHLDRLKNADLVAKNADGYYSTTSFGRIIFSLLPGFSFIADHPGYFLDHDLSLLPSRFISRLGELSNCSFTEGTINNVGLSTKLVREAGERIWFITKEIPQDTSNHHSLKIEGLDIRMIFQDDPSILNETEDCRDHEFREKLRIVQELPAILILTEKAAALMFPNHKGNFDFAAGFRSTDPAFVKWCEDLFEFLWARGSNINEVSG